MTRHLPADSLPLARLDDHLSALCLRELGGPLQVAEDLRRFYAGCTHLPREQVKERLQFLRRLANKLTAIGVLGRYTNADRLAAALLATRALQAMAANLEEAWNCHWQAITALYVSPHHSRGERRSRPDPLPPR